MLQYSICAFLAPALVSAAAFPWAGPEPTLVVPEIDHWSPAPTDGPKLGKMELFRRADDNTCGYISQDPSRSLTCNDEGYICATNTFYGVHGCCNPASIAVCTLFTSCVGSASFSAECTGDCLSDDRVAKCTSAGAPFCYEWHYVYASTVMTEHGCDTEAFTISAWRTPEGATVEPSSEAVGGITDISSSATATSSSTTSSTSSSTTSTGSSEPIESPEPKKKSNNVGAIAGGAVGGVVVIAAIAAGLFFLLNRNRRNKDNAAAAATGANQPFMGPAPGVEEYKPQTAQYASPQPYNATPAAGGFYNQDQDNKQWAQPQVGVTPTSPAPQYPGPVNPGGIPAGYAEAPGNSVHPPVQQPVPQRPVYEAP